MSAETSTQPQFVYIPRAALIASIVLHLMIPATWVTIKGLEYLGIQIFPPTHIKDVYQEFVQVDLVGLPDITIPDLEKLDPTLPEVEKPAIEPAKEAEDDLMALDAIKKALADKEKAEREEKEKRKKADEEKKKALKDIEEELKREQALKALADGKKGRQKLKGNIVSKGTAVQGALGTPKDQFTAIVMAKIKEKFYMLPFQEGKKLSNTAHIELYPTGRVRSKQIVRSSGDAIFDSHVLQAIDEAQPLPIPEDLSIMQGGFTVNFNAEK